MSSVIFPDKTFRRVEDFRQDLRKVCGQFSIEPKTKTGQINASMSLESKGAFEIARISLNAQSVKRSWADVKTEDTDNYLMVFQQSGYSLMHQGAEPALLRTGDMFVVDTTRESHFDFQGRQSGQLTLHLGRDEMARRFGAAFRGGLNIKREDPLSIALRSILTRCLTVGDQESGHLSEAFFGVLGAYLIERQNDRASAQGPVGDLVTAAMTIIARRYKDPGFGPQELAQELGVSLRTVQRSFGKTGITPRAAITQHRLTQAHRCLKTRLQHEASVQRRTVCDIAYAQGFNDLSYFYQQFRKRFGHAPGAIEADLPVWDGVYPEDGCRQHPRPGAVLGL